MKEKIFNYDVSLDVTEIECDVHDATVLFRQTDGDKLTVEFTDAKNIRVGSNESVLYVNQERKPLFHFGEQTIKIGVPAHVIPAVKFYGKKFNLSVTSGIYGEVSVSGESGSIDFGECAAEGVKIIGESIDAKFTGTTIKSGLYVQIERGNVLAENAFALRGECRVKQGNVGLASFSCRECILEALCGNLTASLCGGEQSFNSTLIAKDGTVNRDGVQIEGAERTLRAYTEKGNIVIDFIEESVGLIEPLPIEDAVDDTTHSEEN